MHVVLLAAGGATRFGESKQCALINGVPMLVHVIRLFSEFAQVTTVLGAYQEQIEPVLAQDQDIAVAVDWRSGMGASINAGVSAIAKNATHICIALADQIALKRGDLVRLFEASRARPWHIISAGYKGITGAPAIFPVTYKNQLSALSGDKGARSLLVKYAQKVHTVAIPAAAQDIDTKADLAAWLASGTKATDQTR